MAAVKVNDIVDVSKSINGHSFTIEWLLDSLRTHDKTFIKLFGNRPVKDVSFFNYRPGECGFPDSVSRIRRVFPGFQGRTGTRIFCPGIRDSDAD